MLTAGPAKAYLSQTKRSNKPGRVFAFGQQCDVPAMRSAQGFYTPVNVLTSLDLEYPCSIETNVASPENMPGRL